MIAGRMMMKFDGRGYIRRQLPDVRKYPAAAAVRETQNFLLHFAQRSPEACACSNTRGNSSGYSSEFTRMPTPCSSPARQNLLDSFDPQKLSQMLAHQRGTQRVPPESGMRHAALRAGKKLRQAARINDVPNTLNAQRQHRLTNGPHFRLTREDRRIGQARTLRRERFVVRN
jgi:hypothetical protein